MACCSTLVKVSVLAVIGLLLLLSGLILMIAMPPAIQKMIAEKLAVNNGTDAFKLWTKPSFPLTFGVYLFHVNNSVDVINGQKPVLVQKGPYVFDQYKEKLDISFDDEMDTVSFRGKKTYVFNSEMSNGSLSDVVTMLNVPLLGVSKTYPTLEKVKRFMLNMAIPFNRATPFVTKTVSQMLFEGYPDQLIKVLAEKENRTILPNNTFGFLYGQNGSANDGVYSVFRGNQDISKLVNIVSINNQTSLPYWGTKYCNMLNGTDGSQFPPPVRKDTQLYLYTPELCRSIYLRYEKDVVVKGIRLHRFSLPQQLLSAPSRTPENRCFCSKGNCLESGVMSISACKKGVPIIVSLPHFYQADESFLNATKGLHPEAHLHQIFLDVEPNTGVVMNAAKRLQMNADLKPVSGMMRYGKMPSMTFPMLWVYESATIPTESAEKFKSNLLTVIMLTKAVTYGVIGIGSFILLCLIIYLIVTSLRKKSKSLKTAKSHSVASESNGPAVEKLLTKPGFA